MINSVRFDFNVLPSTITIVSDDITFCDPRYLDIYSSDVWGTGSNSVNLADSKAAVTITNDNTVVVTLSKTVLDNLANRTDLATNSTNTYLFFSTGAFIGGSYIGDHVLTSNVVSIVEPVQVPTKQSWVWRTLANNDGSIIIYTSSPITNLPITNIFIQNVNNYSVGNTRYQLNGGTLNPSVYVAISLSDGQIGFYATTVQLLTSDVNNIRNTWANPNTSIGSTVSDTFVRFTGAEDRFGIAIAFTDGTGPTSNPPVQVIVDSNMSSSYTSHTGLICNHLYAQGSLNLINEASIFTLVPSTFGGNVKLTVPSSLPNSNQFLMSDVQGNLSWATATDTTWPPEWMLIL